LSTCWRLGAATGSLLTLGLKGLGPAGAALDGVVEAVCHEGLDVKGGRLRLRRVSGSLRRLEAPVGAAGIRRLRIYLTAPTLMRGENGIEFNPKRILHAQRRACTICAGGVAGSCDAGFAPIPL
jgi:hypothetical protein